jgi:surface antigen
MILCVATLVAVATFGFTTTHLIQSSTITNDWLALSDAYLLQVNTDGSASATQLPPMNGARYQHSATLLADGKILVAGGVPVNSSRLALSEIYDPSSNTWTPTGSMVVARSGHTATLLNDGRVLVTGGFGGPVSLSQQAVELSSTELFDPMTGSWSAGPSMSTPRALHTATKLADGRVLVVGGPLNDLHLGPLAEIFDPISFTWQSVNTLLGLPLAGQSASLLKDDSVLITGGTDGLQPGYRNRTLIFRPSDNSWVIGPQLAAPHSQAIAAQLPDGSVLIASGQGSVTDTEVLISGTAKWQPAAATLADRILGTSGVTQAGQVVAVGGVSTGPLPTVEVLNATFQKLTPTAPASLNGLVGATMTLIGTESFLIAGGAHSNVEALTARFFGSTVAYAGADDYPSNLRNAPQDSLVDPWGFYNRECTSFAAWRMQRDGHPMSNTMRGGRFGNATNWYANAQAIGIPTTTTATNGAVLQSTSVGHVAYAEIPGSPSTVEDYNWNYTGVYLQHTWAPSDEEFILFGLAQNARQVAGSTVYLGNNTASPATGSRLYSFVPDAAGHLQMRWWNGSAWAWLDQGVPATGVTALNVTGTLYYGDNNAGNLGGSRMHVFVQGSNGHLYDNTWQGTSWVWGDQGVPATGVTVTGGAGTIYFGDNNVSNLSGSRLFAFVWGSNGHLYEESWQGSAWQWGDFGLPASGVTVSGGVGTIYMGDNNVSTLAGSRLFAFVWGSNGHLYEQSWQGSAWQWGDFGLPASGVTVSGGVGTIYMGDNNVSNLANSKLHAFFQGSNGHLYELSWQGSAWQWGDFGLPASGVTVSGGVGTIYFGDNNVSNLSGSRLYAFVQGNNGHLYNETWQGTAWAWGDLGVPASGVTLTGGVGTIYFGDNNVSNYSGSRIYAFVQGSNSHLYDENWQGTAWVWEDQGSEP